MKATATGLRRQRLAITLIPYFLLFKYASQNSDDGGPHADDVASEGTQPSRVSVVSCRWVVHLCCVGCGEKQNVISSLCKAAHVLDPNWMQRPATLASPSLVSSLSTHL